MELSKKKIKIWTIIFWLIVWQVLSMVINQEILLVSPFVVIHRLILLFQQAFFYRSIFYSLAHIVFGFFFALISAVILAILSIKIRWIEELLKPFIFTVKSIPVASFIILVLVWVSAKELSIVISFLMVFPILYENIVTGIRATDYKLLEMAELFQLSSLTKIRYIYFPQVLPYFQSACSLALGMCWKSGIAAEVIGVPKHSIGENLYQAKVYFDTSDLFAWTVVIVICSILFENLFMYLLQVFMKHIQTEV